MPWSKHGRYSQRFFDGYTVDFLTCLEYVDGCTPTYALIISSKTLATPPQSALGPLLEDVPNRSTATCPVQSILFIAALVVSPRFSDTKLIYEICRGLFHFQCHRSLTPRHQRQASFPTTPGTPSWRPPSPVISCAGSMLLPWNRQGRREKVLVGRKRESRLLRMVATDNNWRLVKGK